MRLCVPWLQSQRTDLLALQDTPPPSTSSFPRGWGRGGEVGEWQHFLRLHVRQDLDVQPLLPAPIPRSYLQLSPQPGSLPDSGQNVLSGPQDP
jgi:hypothetical protein